MDAAGVDSGHFLCKSCVTADDAVTLEFHENAAGGDWVIAGGEGHLNTT